MRRKSFQKMHCPIARTLERVGEWWSILILRDALHGYTRFEEFRESLGVAQDQNAPPLADPLQRAGDRTMHLLKAFPAHGAKLAKLLA